MASQQNDVLLNKLIAEVTQLKRQLSQQQSQLSQQQSSVANIEQTVDQMARQAQQSHHSCEDLRIENASLIGELELMRQQKDMFAKETTELRDENDALRSELRDRNELSINYRFDVRFRIFKMQIRRNTSIFEN